MNQKLHQHLSGGIEINPFRQSTKDTGACCLLPEEYGQWACVAKDLDPNSPYLLLWVCIMVMEGSCVSSQRKLLRACGWIVPFRWKVPGSNEIQKPVSLFSISLFSLSPLLSSCNLPRQCQRQAEVWPRS
jgi:hypothetical protein